MKLNLSIDKCDTRIVKQCSDEFCEIPVKDLNSFSEAFEAAEPSVSDDEDTVEHYFACFQRATCSQHAGEYDDFVEGALRRFEIRLAQEAKKFPDDSYWQKVAVAKFLGRYLCFGRIYFTELDEVFVIKEWLEAIPGYYFKPGKPLIIIDLYCEDETGDTDYLVDSNFIDYSKLLLSSPQPTEEEYTDE